MDKETIIKKWLDNELTDKELLEFQQMEEYDSFVKISDRAKWFSASEFDTEKALDTLKPIITRKGVPKTMLQRLKPLARIAAVVVLGLFVYTLIFDNSLTTYETAIAEKETINLPDASIVTLNAVSELQYLSDNWEKNRELKLMGEAYFKVATGSTFKVVTDVGSVAVVGTEFNVIQRDQLLEVECYEGKVDVYFAGDRVRLTAGKSFRLLNGVSKTGVITSQLPSWVDGVSSFTSIPFQWVLNEFERQYGIPIVPDSDLDTTLLFTGSFVHHDKELALKSITMPFKLNFSQDTNQIKLYH